MDFKHFVKDLLCHVQSKTTSEIFTDMVFVDCTCQGGDSGGIVYSYIKSKNIRYTVGIVFGVLDDESTTVHYMVYSKADNVLNALGVERY